MYNTIGAVVLHSLIQQSIRNGNLNNTKQVSFEKSIKEKYDVCFPVSDLSTISFLETVDFNGRQVIILGHLTCPDGSFVYGNYV